MDQTVNYSVILLQVVITYTSYLCKQLLSISSEVRASMVIQRAWRRFHAKMELSKKLVILHVLIGTLLHTCTI